MFKTGSFAFFRTELHGYDQSAGLFEVHISYESKEQKSVMLETLIQFFSEYGSFHFKDLLVGISYNREIGECFILRFRDQSFADEVTALTG